MYYGIDISRIEMYLVLSMHSALDVHSKLAEGYSYLFFATIPLIIR